MTPSKPTLPSNQAFVVQFRKQPSGAPSWGGRVEHLASYQVAGTMIEAPLPVQKLDVVSKNNCVRGTTPQRSKIMSNLLPTILAGLLTCAAVPPALAGSPTQANFQAVQL